MKDPQKARKKLQTFRKLAEKYNNAADRIEAALVEEQEPITVEGEEVETVPEPEEIKEVLVEVETDQMLWKGVQMQGTARFQAHKTKDFEEVVNRICVSVKATGATTLRIPGGKNARWSFPEGDGIGNEKFAGRAEGALKVKNQPGEPNHIKVLVEVAKRCNLPIWVTMPPGLTETETKDYFGFLKNSGVQVLGITPGNELYAPEYVNEGTAEQEIQNISQMFTWLRESGYDSWLGVPVLLGLGAPSREQRATRYNAWIKQYINLTDDKIILDIHPYCPLDEIKVDPRTYLLNFFESLEETFGDKKVVITEWARKNQHSFPASERTLVIQQYVKVYKEMGDKIVGAYYNTMPGDKERGLFDYETMKLTVQGEFFAAVK
jgi:hypothetical protein